jgi:hypothetical protein
MKTENMINFINSLEEKINKDIIAHKFKNEKAVNEKFIHIINDTMSGFAIDEIRIGFKPIQTYSIFKKIKLFILKLFKRQQWFNLTYNIELKEKVVENVEFTINVSEV